jgi:hypothetical protein
MTNETQSNSVGATRGDGDSIQLSGAQLTVLSKAHVRHTLRYLDQQETATLEEIADAVCGMQAVDSDSVMTSTQRDRIRITLYHVTLPQLDDLNYITYDRESRTVTEMTIPQDVSSIVERIE